MPSKEDSTRISQVSSNDFLLNKTNVIWLLSHRKFYTNFPSFAPLQRPVEELATFMREKGLMSKALAPGCTRCDALKAWQAQGRLLDGFAKIFIWSSDHGRMQELKRLRIFVGRLKRKSFKRVILAYSGPATKKKERLVIVE